MRALVLVALAVLCLGFEWEGRLSRLERELESGNPRQRRDVVRRMATYSAAEVRAALLRALRDRDPLVRREAAEVAGRVRLTEAAPLLLDWLEDEDADVRTTAAAALGPIRDPRALPRLVRALGDANSEVRRAAVIALGQLGDAGAVVPLLGRLDDDDDDVRVAAARMLAALGDAAAVIPLVRRARDESPAVRQAVYDALGELRDPRAAPALVAALRDEAEPARLAAIAALGRLGTERSVPPLGELVGGSDVRVARAALVALGAVGSQPALGPIVDALGVPQLRATATEILASHEAPHLTRMLAVALENARAPDRATALATVLSRRLERAPAPEVSAALTGALEDARGDPIVLMRALARCGDASVLVTLLERLEVGGDLRQGALEALGEYFERHPGDGRAADPLLAILSDIEPRDRVTVVRLLGLVGATRALPALRPLLDHPDPAVRLATVEAIGAIGDPTGADVLLGLLEARDPRLRFEVARSLGATASASVVGTLVARLQTREPTDRHAILNALGAALEHVTLDAAGTATVASTLATVAQGPDNPLADRAIDTLARWPSEAASRLLEELASRRRSALRSLRNPEPLRRALSEAPSAARVAAAARLGEVGTVEDLPRLLQTVARGRWPVPAAASFALARLAGRGVQASAQQLCPLLRSRDAYVRANVIVALTASGHRCPDHSPQAFLRGQEHAAPVRAAAAHWLRRIDSSPTARALLTRCAAEELSREVAAACAASETPTTDATADVYVYAPDGTTLLREHLVALRFEDASALVVETDANGHVRWEHAPRGRLYLDDPLRTPLQP